MLTQDRQAQCTVILPNTVPLIAQHVRSMHMQPVHTQEKAPYSPGVRAEVLADRHPPQQERRPSAPTVGSSSWGKSLASRAEAQLWVLRAQNAEPGASVIQLTEPLLTISGTNKAYHHPPELDQPMTLQDFPPSQRELPRREAWMRPPQE